MGDIWVSLCMCGDNWTYYEENGRERARQRGENVSGKDKESGVSGNENEKKEGNDVSEVSEAGGPWMS